eukprot:8751483-Pyramimonas_sp.AAC.1
MGGLALGLLRTVVKRKLGAELEKGENGKPPPKRRRVKTFTVLRMLDNQLRGIGMPLHRFKIPRAPDGTLAGDPFSWPILSLCPDAGPDMTAADHFMAYGGADLNVQ